jgi:TPR repeat protein
MSKKINSLNELKNDISKGNTVSFINNMIQHLHQDDLSGGHFSVFNYLSKLCEESNNSNFCFHLFSTLQRYLKMKDPIIEYLCGICFDVGCGIKQNSIKAFEFYQKSSHQKYSRAIYNLAICYRNGEGVEKDPLKAIQLYEQSVQLGNSHSMFNLAICYHTGTGVKVNYQVAFELFMQASGTGDGSANYYCFFYLSRGLGSPRNITYSLDFLQFSAESDCFNSFIENAILLLHGTFVKQDEKKAAFYFQKSSNRHEVQGKLWFGICLIEGKGIQKSFYRGLELIHQASEESYFLAQLYFSLVQPFRSHFR